ncbi:type II toxin-antitoxin system prevent-host-death family antitoxin [Methylobacterium sp. J-048]|uniref:type II toxin-antitoxin system Phd/YefM family antitoxin n=1 Tax=Methylobacterium sp. J-048 TaxID=2836635 RepID=UPI001FBBE382|nr:type II toxin-antitoxin system prevent-host-death family antitoxin [Methylobacterium sp. J-048]MCJ2059454.1 type II toxin-antitoxin system prevent-host-death family antitoxin [Methylobacterium sp. J-048]
MDRMPGHAGLPMPAEWIGSELQILRAIAAMRISVEAAEGQLPRLIEVASGGEEVVLARDDVPIARIVPIAASPFRIGILAHQTLGTGPNWLEPMPDDDLALWEGER